MKTASLKSKVALTQRGQRTRQQLLDAAEVVFGERGFELTSIAEITRRADVALGTFYVYFTNKQAIFSELVRELGRRLREALATATATQTTRLAKERAGFAAFIAFANKHRNLYRIVRQAEFVDEDVYREYYRTLGTAYARGLQRAMDEGEIGRFDPEAIAFALMGVADFIGMRFVTWRSPAHLERVTNDVMHFIEHGLASPARLETHP